MKLRNGRRSGRSDFNSELRLERSSSPTVFFLSIAWYLTTKRPLVCYIKIGQAY